MADAVQRADTVIKGLLNFSRSERLALSPTDLNSIIEESLVLVRHELTKHHTVLEKHLAERLPQMQLDTNKIKQVLINVFMNAIQAMGDNGNLSVKTFIQTASNDGKSPVVKNVVIKIEDTGIGISEDKLDKLFEPFFHHQRRRCRDGLGIVGVSKYH